MSRNASQWSLRTLLIATAIVPAAVYMLVKANDMLVSAVVTIAITAWTAMAIIAIVGKGERRAFACGALVAATVYGLTIHVLGTELNLRGSNLFTSGLLYYAHEACVTRVTSQRSFGAGMPGGGMMSGMGGMPAMTMTTETPIAGQFATIGHVYWGILMGVAGGWFAGWVVRREQTEIAASPNTETPTAE